MPDGTNVAAITRTGDAMAMTGKVELAIETGDGWTVDQVLNNGYPAAPIAPRRPRR